MNDFDIFKDYTIELDKFDKFDVELEVSEKGSTKYLDKKLIYLDCSREVDGMRMMQTIGYPYRKEISEYIYCLCTYLEREEYEQYYQALCDIHASNLTYEQENPPVWYGGKKAKKEFENKYKTSSKKEAKPRKPKVSKEDKAKASLKMKLLGSALTNFKLNI